MRFLLAILLLPFCLWAKVPLLAVSELSSRGVSKNDAAIIADRLRAEILSTGKVRVLERSEMDKILREQAFQKSGACDTSECAVEIGRLLAVDRIVVGSVGKLGNLFTISVRLLDVRTGEILFSANEDSEGKLEKLLVQSVPLLAKKIATGTVDAASGNAMRTGTGDLQVTVDEAGARLTLDGVLVKGKSPYFFERLEAGSHTLVARTKDKIGEVNVELGHDDLQKISIPMVLGTGGVKLYSEPTGSKVLLDGTEIGETPLKNTDVTVGEHKVIFQKEGYMDSVVSLSVAMELTTTSRVKLEPCGILNLSSNASISPKIWRGKDTLYPAVAYPIQLPPGHWHLSPRADRTWKSNDTSFDIRVGERTSMDLVLPKYFATVKVRTLFPAKVVIDGQHVGDSPLDYGVLEPGQHSMEVSMSDSSWKRQFKVVSGQILSFHLGMEPPSALLKIKSRYAAAVYLDHDEAQQLHLDTSFWGRESWTWASDSLTSGTHQLKLVADGYRSWDTVLQLPRKSVTKIDVNLVRELNSHSDFHPVVVQDASNQTASAGAVFHVLSGVGMLVSGAICAYWGEQTFVPGSERQSDVAKSFLLSGGAFLFTSIVFVATANF